MNQIKTGNYITQKRKEKNLAQEQLAEKIGVSNKTISKWECGKCMPDYSSIEVLCKELNITVSELINGHDSQQQGVVDDESFLHLVKEVETQKISHIQTDGICLMLLSIICGHISTCCSSPISAVLLNIVSIVSIVVACLLLFGEVFEKEEISKVNQSLL